MAKKIKKKQANGSGKHVELVACESEYDFVSIKSHEVLYFAEHILNFYRAIGQNGVANNPELFYEKYVKQHMGKEATEFVVGLRKGWKYPFTEDDVRGFMWAHMINTLDTVNPGEVPTLLIEILYTVKPGMVKLLQELHWRVGFLAQRYGAQKMRLEVSTNKNQKMWAKFGFKPVAAIMEFAGGSDIYYEVNPYMIPRSAKGNTMKAGVDYGQQEQADFLNGAITTADSSR